MSALMSAIIAFANRMRRILTVSRRVLRISRKMTSVSRIWRTPASKSCIGIWNWNETQLVDGDDEAEDVMAEGAEVVTILPCIEACTASAEAP